MCLIFFSINRHPCYKLVVAANRDEFYDRQTAHADFWKDHPELLGGRDLKASGTWMGITRQGRISFITNYRDPHHIDPLAPSRGKLVSDYLLGVASPEIYLQALASRASSFNGFNLLAGTPEELWYYSNYENKVRKVDEGFHAISNHLLETPWPKVTRIKSQLIPLVTSGVIDAQKLLDTLYDGTRADDNQLPDTGIGLERERSLSAMFIKSPNYGTRCSTVLLIGKENDVHFVERTYDMTTFAFREHEYKFELEM